MSQPSLSRQSTVAALGLLLLSAGCNFRPMYGALPGGGDLAAVLSAVELEPLDTLEGERPAARAGQKLRNELIFLFTGGGHPAPPQYRLTVKVASSVGALTVQRLGGLPSSEMVVGSATYTLKRISDGRALVCDTASARASYDRSTQRFAALRALRDAEDRAMTTLAELIRTRIAAKLAGASPDPDPACQKAPGPITPRSPTSRPRVVP